MTWRKGLPAGNESSKCRWDIVPYTRGKGLEIGCGIGKAFPHFTGVDSGRDAKLFGAQITADIKADAADLSQFADCGMDFVFSSHTLEHIEDHLRALLEWWRVIKVGGHLVLYLPHADFYPRKGEPDANPDHCHDFLPNDIIEAMHAIGEWDLVVNEARDAGDEYSLLQVYEKREKGNFHSWQAPKPSKTCALVRYGAWGDGLQISSVLPGLKAQGYHITLYTTPRCHEVLKHEPLIDRVILQDEEQVPNLWLGEYWDNLRTKYDRFINLSECVEATFLAMPDRSPYHWPKAARHALMNGNYGEHLHAMAGVPYNGLQSRFVASKDEERWARERVAEMGASTVIMWVLSGSAVHKVWPHIDVVIANILKNRPRARIITVGDAGCAKLEAPWVDEPRIIRRSSVWSIRETLAVAQRCDMVIGPETGVMSGVAMEAMPKIVLLSHSSDNNLTRDWRNTCPVWSEVTPCAPCHKMIHKWEQCVRHDSGTAQCMHDITAEEVWSAVWAGLTHAEREAA